MPRITNWLEVERRLANYNTSIKTIETSLVKTNNSRNIMLHALLINLKDLLENQSEISLWFYDIDKPTTSSLPYTSWSRPADHYGDIFYSRTKGVIYQFTTSGKWEQLNDATLLNSMALTNSKLESGDHERQVFTTEPTPPYESGDWWIQSDGTLFICQIGRQTGNRHPNDFINSLDYAEAIAKATDNILEVLKGTVIQTTDSAVTYLDKATNTTTTISGNSIKTGELISNNYLSGVRGTLISLDDGTINTKYFQLSSTGEVTCQNIRATNGYFSGEINATSGFFSGEIEANEGNISGFVLSSNKLSKSLYGLYDYSILDAEMTLPIIRGDISLTSYLLNILDATQDNNISISDASKIAAICRGSTTNNKYVSGNFAINSNDPKYCLKVTKDGEVVAGLGIGGITSKLSTTEYLLCGNLNDSNYRNYIIIDGIGQSIVLSKNNDASKLTITPDTIVINGNPVQTGTSDKNLKHNIKDTDVNALDEITKIKHIQFDWNKDNTHEKLGYIAQDLEKIYPNLVIKNKYKDGYMYSVNMLNMIALCTKAIQELHEEIIELKG